MESPSIPDPVIKWDDFEKNYSRELLIMDCLDWLEWLEVPSLS